jgi:hypothetical protein
VAPQSGQEIVREPFDEGVAAPLLGRAGDRSVFDREVANVQIIHLPRRKRGVPFIDEPMTKTMVVAVPLLPEARCASHIVDKSN